jgi:hypothetical protein
MLRRVIASVIADSPAIENRHKVVVVVVGLVEIGGRDGGRSGDIFSSVVVVVAVRFSVEYYFSEAALMMVATMELRRIGDAFGADWW